jgi:uncharacterized protein (TIGR02145 family)
MNKRFFILLFLAIAAYGQQTTVAVLPSEGAALGNDELEALTDEMREAALKALPPKNFVLLKQDVVVRRLGGAENYIKECKESSCIVDLGKKAQVDYVAQASVGKLGDDVRLKVELYNVRTEGLVGMFNDEAENVRGLLAIVKKKAPEVFGKIPGASGGSRGVSPIVAGGIGGLQIADGGYELDEEKRYVANLSTEPPGAVLSFDGLPSSSCTKTPCKAELPEGNVRIIAALEQYETADTTVSIRQNNQNINIKLKPNFGVLEIKPAYSENIGSDRGWSLTINGKEQSSYENRFSPGNYEVRLSHECYEDIGFKAGINKGSHEVFDMARHLGLKTGGLVLSAEKDGEPASEPVFANGRQIGETPFSGTVPVCAEIGIGAGRDKIDVKIAYKQTVRHKHKIDGVLTDSRDGRKYKIVKIGRQTWMAENLNYKTSDGASRCFVANGAKNLNDNDNANCNTYGRYYNWATAMDISSTYNTTLYNPSANTKYRGVCPMGWHIPSGADWNVLMKSVNPNCSDNTTCEIAGTKLKAASGCYNDGNGTDDYGFSGLPVGEAVNLNGTFYSFGLYGTWWSTSESASDRAYRRYIVCPSDNHQNKFVWSDHDNKHKLYNVRCVQN